MLRQITGEQTTDNSPSSPDPQHRLLYLMEEFRKSYGSLMQDVKGASWAVGAESLCEHAASTLPTSATLLLTFCQYLAHRVTQ